MKFRAFLIVLSLAAGCQQDNGSPAESSAGRFTALDAGGMVQAIGSGVCTEDSLTGLIWEVKSEAPGLHHWRNTYSWFNPHENVDELDYRGLADGGSCEESDCDTWNYVRAVNDAGLCGFFDWRMPSRNELMSISDLSKTDKPPTAYLEFFPNTRAAEYWTGFDYSTQYESAWAWNFQYGHDRVDWKKTPKYVRVVRGSADNLDSVKE